MQRDYRRRGWRTRSGSKARLGRSALAAAALIATAAGCSGASDDLVNRAVSSAEEVTVFELGTGACFNSDTLTSDGSVNDDTVVTIDLVECSEPHRFQVFTTITHDAPEGAPFDIAAISAEAQNRCDDGFATAVGRTFEDAPELELLPLRPTDASWQALDRTTYCIAYPGDETVFSEKSLLAEDL